MWKLLLKGLPVIFAGAKAVAGLQQGTQAEQGLRMLPSMAWMGVTFGPLLATFEEADIIQVARATGMEIPGAPPVLTILTSAMQRAQENGY